jgi:FSR family fosmidomycin resistance protein-like MFS transporter
MSDSATATAVQPEAGRAWLIPLLLYCVGHFLVDGYQTALGTMQPLLQDRYHLSFTQAGVLAGCYLCSGHMLQPLYGFFCDRFPSRLYSALGPAIIAVFLTCIGWASGFHGLLGMVILSGIGAAAFHPQAASNAVAAITRNRGSAMALFISCGTFGMAAGPMCFSPLLTRLGLERLHLSAIPGVAITLLMVLLLPPTRQSSRGRREFDWAPLRAVRKPMTVLFLLVLIRSVVQVTFAQFLPLYLHSARNYSISEAALSLSIYLFGGAIGSFAGGALADRYGARRVILISMIGSVPFLALFIFTQGVLSTAGLWLGGLILLFTMPVNVVLAQELVPAQAGTVSALMMGFAWGIAGLVFIPLVGWIADIWSMQAGFAVLTVFPLLGYLVGLTLPRDIGGPLRARSRSREAIDKPTASSHT